MASEGFTQLSENLFRFTDSCNAYLVRDGDAGLMIDAGSGACLRPPPRRWRQERRMGAAHASPS